VNRHRPPLVPRLVLALLWLVSWLAVLAVLAADRPEPFVAPGRDFGPVLMRSTTGVRP
jgi:hypothetical protein